jgi:serine/threonine-protein kinase
MTDSVARLSAALADRYTIERQLGSGGMATVYLAHDVKHDRHVALKVLRPELAAVLGAERFVVEIKTTANLQHPHILPLFDSGTADGFLYYVMPYIEGETLRDMLNRETQLGIEEAVRIASDVAGALDYAHRHHVIHRDIKPENILLHDGRPMVADFGIALALSAAAGGRMTETGLSLGTPHYMSPEQATAEKELTNRSDIYSLGSVLYEMLTGSPPHVGSSAQQIIMKIVTDTARPVTELRKSVPPNVAAAVAKSLEKLPADRFHSAAEFAEALKNPAFATTAAGGATARTALPPYRRTALSAGLVLATIVATVLAVWGWLAVRRAANEPATWQYITLGDSAQLWMAAPALALSPDGNALAFKSDQQNGLLWLKRRNQLNPTSLAGTERANNPTFSPDGEWIAFVADGHLKKVRTNGGPTVTLADTVVGGYGGTAWLDDGTLVYVVPALNELRRVNAAGGTSTVALHDNTLTGGGIGMPIALPGAKGVLFQYCASGCVTMGIHVLDLRTGKQKALITDVVQAWYLPTGHLLYARRDGVVVAAPFSLRTLEMTGEAVPVLENVDVRALAGFAPLVVSASGSLVYVRGTAGSAANTVVRVNRAGAITVIDTTWYGAFNSFALSPDGRRLAVGVGTGAGLNIWTKQMDRGPFTRLTFGNQDRRPAWSTDGRTVAFIRDSASTSGVYARPVDGSGPDRFMARLDRQVQEVSWTNDGKWLVMRTDNGAAGAGDLIAVRTSGDTTPVPLLTSNFSEMHPSVSPDGRWLAYTSNESGNNEVYVRPFPNTSGGRWQVSNGGGSEPRWSRNGRELFFRNPTGRLFAAQVSPGPSFVVSDLKPLFDASGFAWEGFHVSYDVATDGQTFYFINARNGNANGAIEIVAVDNWFRDVRQRLAR